MRRDKTAEHHADDAGRTPGRRTSSRTWRASRRDARCPISRRPTSARTQVPPDSRSSCMAPDQLAAAYADVDQQGRTQRVLRQFEAEGDQFRASDRRGSRRSGSPSSTQTAAPTRAASRSTRSPASHPPLALATLESGAIVAVNVNETDTVKPTNCRRRDQARRTTRRSRPWPVSSSPRPGFTTTYSDQLFFYVPGSGLDREDPPSRLSLPTSSTQR